MKNKTKDLKIILAAGLLIISPIVLSYTSVKEYNNVVIQDKERITKSDGDGGVDSYYLVYTNKGVFKNEDSFVQFKFNSSDYQGKLKKGETYNIKVNWFRVPVFSMYENILEIEKGE